MSRQNTTDVMRRVVMSPEAWAVAEEATLRYLGVDRRDVRSRPVGMERAEAARSDAAWAELVTLGVADRPGTLAVAWAQSLAQHLTARLVVMIGAVSGQTRSIGTVSLVEDLALAVRQIRQDHPESGVPRRAVEVTFFTTSALLPGVLRLLPPSATLRARPTVGSLDRDARSIVRAPAAGETVAELSASMAPMHTPPRRATSTVSRSRVTVQILSRVGETEQLALGEWERAATWSGAWALEVGALRAVRGRAGRPTFVDVCAGNIAAELLLGVVEARSWVTTALEPSKVRVAA